MHIFIKSDDSIITHPGNTSCDFLSELPKEITLEVGTSCALVQCQFGSEPKEELLLCSDIVENSCVHGKIVPILAIVSKSGTLDFPYYFPVTRDRLLRIRISILTKELKTPEEKPKDCRLVLHLKK